jgi:hypothetical protein
MPRTDHVSLDSELAEQIDRLAGPDEVHLGVDPRQIAEQHLIL